MFSTQYQLFRPLTDNEGQILQRTEGLVVNLGCRDYLESLRIQAAIVEKRKQAKIPDCLLFVDYEHTITLGRSGKPEHLLASRRDLEEKHIQFCLTDRGGDITYHGPGQLIAYPVLDLKSLRRDIDWYLRRLEQCVMATLADFGISSRTVPGATGVWVGDEKIAAIGVRTSQWVTSHGVALNVNTDLTYFNTIIPCGIQEKGVTSISKILQVASTPTPRVKERFCAHFEELFERSLCGNPEEGASSLWN
ncbi:MAG: lipoyl(octanoyl) transferase LipB [Terriglobia bacterium]